MQRETRPAVQLCSPPVAETVCEKHPASLTALSKPVEVAKRPKE
jgi:hypothetical protein